MKKFPLVLKSRCYSLALLLTLLPLNHTVFARSSDRSDEFQPARIERAENEPQNWLTYGGNYRAWRYSPLNQITTQNVKSLAPVWAFPTGELRGGLNATPLVADGVMYLIGPRNRLFAMNAATGQKLWSYEYQLPKDFSVPYTPGTRGVAMAYGLIYLGTLDNHLVAIDAKTGREVWDVEIQDVRQCGCNVTSAPLVVKDKVIVGNTGGETAHRSYLTAFDAKTGKLLWRFYTIPGQGEPGRETWDQESWRFGGGPTWLTGSYDPELNLVYWGIGNPSSDFYGEGRKGDNLYTNSIVALDPETGKMKWYFQELPHDLYDFDSAYECVLIDARWKGADRKLLVHPNKGGYTWVIDRTNGKFVSGYPFIDTISWMKGVDAEGKPTGRLDIPPDKETYVCPSVCGGRSWNHSSYSPRTQFWYNTGWEFCGIVKPQLMDVVEGQGLFGGGVDLVPPKGIAPYGHIDAYDPATGEKKWRYKTKYANLSSLLTTAGDLLFAGDVEGNAFALDSRTGEKLWSFNTGGGISGSPISYSVNGRQYVAVPSGMGSLIGGVVPVIWPETRGRLPEGASTLFVFALPEQSK